MIWTLRRYPAGKQRRIPHNLHIMGFASKTTVDGVFNAVLQSSVSEGVRSSSLLSLPAAFTF